MSSERRRRGEAALELLDHVDEVALRVDAESEAVVHQGERDREPLAAAGGAGEEKAAARDREQPDPSLNTAVVDLEAPVLEAAAEEGTLIDRVGAWRVAGETSAAA
jgi:hypothetical protein